jgi:membrane fusion protein (multidrug efflux system)
MPAGAAEAVVIGTEGSNPALEAATRATIVEAAIAKPDGQIRSGVFATAHVALGENERAVFVPRDAVIADPNTNSFRVFTIADNIARLRVLQPGPEQARHVRLLAGVAAGDAVATAGFAQLFDGAAVRTVEQSPRKERLAAITTHRGTDVG